MSLRARLVAALGLLLTVGLVAFGVGTYNRYSAAEYQRLDDRLRSALPSAERVLDGGPGQTSEPDGQGPRSGERANYAERRDSDGKVVSHDPSDTRGGKPALPTKLPALDKPFTVASEIGSGDWRALARLAPGGDTTVIVAIPLGDVSDLLRQLVVIETIAGLALLALLTIGSWLIVRQGLRPLEDMAESAGAIHEGDMSLRVAPADGRGEVGQLGLALNSMLDNLQVAFAARQESEARLRQFLADASHELRTPLTSIQGFAELFRLGVANEHVDQDVIMRRIEEESQRMRTLVDDLLLLARLDERRDIEPSHVDLAVLAADACSDAVAAAPDRAITLDATHPVVVDGVEDQLRQAIANLVSNAVSHTPAGTPIDVTTHAAAGRAVITVRDHGPGLSDDARQHAFDRFWRSDPSRVGPRSGLGLSIVAAIAATHHGAAVAANHPDGGAVFTIDLPIAASRQV